MKKKILILGSKGQIGDYFCNYLRKKKCSIKEVPIVFNDRQHGKSKIPKLETLRTLKNLIILRVLDFFNYLKKYNLYEIYIK